MDENRKFGCHNNQADRYDAQVQGNIADYIRENYYAILDRVVHEISPSEGQRILDIGVGTGLLSERIDKGIDLYGIDISGRMMAQARAKGLGIWFSYGDFLHIPFRDESFDRLVSTFAFHHLRPEEKEQAYPEMDRVVRPGGIIVMGDYMFKNDDQRRDLVRKFESEERSDMIEELDEEFFLDISHDAPILERRGYRISHERLSTLSWVLTCTKRAH